MESERAIKGYVASLDQIVKGSHLWLKETVEDLQEKVQMVTPERHVPQSWIADIRKIYREIQDQLTKIKGVQQLLEGKYRQHYRRDVVRDKEILEFAFVAKNCYLRFESTLEQMEAMKRLRGRVSPSEPSPADRGFRWFHSSEHQSKLLRNLRELNGLGYEISPGAGGRERREVVQEKPRSVSLFILSGEEKLMDGLQSRMRLRTYDISERSGRKELRVALTHLKETSSSDAAKVILRSVGREEFSQLKCLLIPIRSPKDLERKELSSAGMLLQKMARGEIRRLGGVGPTDIP
jgi:hypothetical protein